MNCKLYVPDARLSVDKLKMYPPSEPRLALKRKSLSGFALPGACGIPEKPDTFVTAVAWTTMEDAETSFPVTSHSVILIGNVPPW